MFGATRDACLAELALELKYTATNLGRYATLQWAAIFPAASDQVQCA